MPSHGSSAPAALAGLRVIEVADGLAGPFAGKCFAAQGAQVVKIERPKVGDPSRSFGPFPDDVAGPDRSGMFAYLNAGKQSVAIDVTSSVGRSIMQRLAGSADVLLASAGSASELRSIGATYDDQSAVAEGTVVTTITPFGMDGPLTAATAHDVNFCALGTITTTIGERDREPLTPPLELSGYQAGLCAASGTLLALFARKRTGLGQHVDVSPLDAWATVHQGSGLMNALAFGSTSRRSGRRRRDAYPFHLMPAKDGLVCMIARDGHQWKRFVQDVVDDPALGSERYRDRRKMGLEYPDEVDALLAPWFAVRTRAEIFELCRSAHVPFSPVRTLDEVASCEQLAARGFFVTIPPSGDSGIEFLAPGAPYRLGATPWPPPAAPPRLGEHTVEVLEDAGYGSDDIDTWRAAGVL